MSSAVHKLRVPLNRRLRVLHVLPSFGVGGAEQMAGHLMTGLSRQHDVAGLSLYRGGSGPIEIKLAQAGIPVFQLDKRPGFDPRMFFAVDRVFARFQPDVVHTHVASLRYVWPLLLRRRSLLAVHTLHNLAEHESDAFGRAIQWIAFRTRVIPVAISREVAASVGRVYGLECRALVPNCIPIDVYRNHRTERAVWREREGIDQDAVVFTCVARLDRQKNPVMLIEAFAALRNPRAHLVIMGDGDLKEPVEAAIRRHRIEHNVHLIGKRTGPQDVPDCLAASDVFVLSSDWEGNPLAVMEAMAAGLPVVSTSVGGVPELVESGENGLLVSPGDSAAFSGAMRVLLDNPKTRVLMSKSARAHATRSFSLERMVKGYSDLYESALAKG